MPELYLFEENQIKYGFTPTLFPKTVGGVEYSPTAIKRGKVKRTDNFTQSPLSFRFERSHSYARRLLNSTIEDLVLVTVFDDGGLPFWRGKFIKAKAQDSYIEIYCESTFAATLEAGKNLTLSNQCWKTIYTPACGLLKENFVSSYPGITATTNEISIPTIAEPDGYFNGGYAVLNGQTRFITSNVGNIITLYTPFTDIQLGTISLYPHCHLTADGCRAKGNFVNFSGFEKMSTVNPFKAEGML